MGGVDDFSAADGHWIEGTWGISSDDAEDELTEGEEWVVRALLGRTAGLPYNSEALTGPVTMLVPADHTGPVELVDDPSLRIEVC